VRLLRIETLYGRHAWVSEAEFIGRAEGRMLNLRFRTGRRYCDVRAKLRRGECTHILRENIAQVVGHAEVGV